MGGVLIKYRSHSRSQIFNTACCCELRGSGLKLSDEVSPKGHIVSELCSKTSACDCCRFAGLGVACVTAAQTVVSVHFERSLSRTPAWHYNATSRKDDFLIKMRLKDQIFHCAFLSEMVLNADGNLITNAMVSL